MIESLCISIADCDICKDLPQKIHLEQDYRAEIPQEISPQLARLTTVLVINEDTDSSYCSSVTRLLKCPQCGTYYYLNLYDDEGEHFMDPTYHDTTFRRYDPVTTMSLLESLVAMAPGDALPPTFGALKKAFSEGTTVPATEVANPELVQVAKSAAVELEELQKRLPSLIQEMIEVLMNRSLNWHVKMYITESLLIHFIQQDSFDQIMQVLLKNKDPVVRVEAADKLIGTATEDAPVTDLTHLPQMCFKASKKVLSKKKYLLEIAHILFDVALHSDEKTMDYDHGYERSKYHKLPLRYKALYTLALIAEHADIGFVLPEIFTLVSLQSVKISNRVFELLKTLVKRQKQYAPIILAELERLDESMKQAFAKEFSYTSLIAECKGRKQE